MISRSMDHEPLKIRDIMGKQKLNNFEIVKSFHRLYQAGKNAIMDGTNSLLIDIMPLVGGHYPASP
jgi:hypothetical protein